MCSVRQRPIPSAPNSRALVACSGVSAFARTFIRRISSDQPRMVWKSSLIRGGTRLTAPTITRPVPPSIVITSPGADVVAADRRGACGEVEHEALAADDARLAHPARHDRRVGGHAAVDGEDPLRVDHPVDVVGGGLGADEDHVLLRLAPRLGLVGVEHDLPAGRPRRGVEALRRDLEVRVGVDHRVQQLVELGGSIRATASSRVISPSSTIATALFTAAAAVRFAVRVCSMKSRSSSIVNSTSCMSR